MQKHAADVGIQCCGDFGSSLILIAAWSPNGRKLAMSNTKLQNITDGNFSYFFTGMYMYKINDNYYD